MPTWQQSGLRILDHLLGHLGERKRPPGGEEGAGFTYHVLPNVLLPFFSANR